MLPLAFGRRTLNGAQRLIQAAGIVQNGEQTSTIWIGNELIAAEHGRRSRADVLTRTLRWLEARASKPSHLVREV